MDAPREAAYTVIMNEKPWMVSAGSLRIADIPALSAAGPDYLGFRGGLCRGFDRTNGIDPLRVAEAVRALRPQAQDAA